MSSKVERMVSVKMKNNNPMKAKIFLVSFIVILISLIALNAEATPDANNLGCHPLEEYTILVDEENMEIEAETSGTITLEVTATGPDVVIDVYPDALDNELFVISPSTEIVDNSEYDLDSSTDSIRVELTITVPSESGLYILRILSRGPALTGVSTPLDVVDITITVGVVVKGLFEIIFDHNNIYLGGLSLIFALIGIIVYHFNLKREKSSKIYGIFMIIAFSLTTLNIFLILNDALDFTSNFIDLTDIENINQLNHIILGIIGYIAGIIVVIGTFTNVQAFKIKLGIYAMFLPLTLNFFYGIFIISPNLGLGS